MASAPYSAFRFCGPSGEPIEALCAERAKALPKNQRPITGWLRAPANDGQLLLWRPEGCRCYLRSGLLRWHHRVVGDTIQVERYEVSGPVAYKDDHQLIIDRTRAHFVERIPLWRFLNSLGLPTTDQDEDMRWQGLQDAARDSSSFLPLH